MDDVTERASHAAASTTQAASLNGGNRLFASGGETAALLASIHWEDTPLGPVETWPQTLRTSVRICLSSRHAIIVWWGPDLIFFYNDAYAPTLGMKQPWAAGKPGREVWAEIWDTIGPMLEGVLRTGEPTWSDDQRLFLERSGYLEETYHTYSYSPIEDDTGTVMGVFTAVTETTQRVLSERRARLARDLGTELVDARSTEDVCARAMRVFAAAPADIPFALLYSVDSQVHEAMLLDTASLAAGTPLSPRTVDFAETEATQGAGRQGEAAADPWSLGTVARSGRELVVRNPGLQEMPHVEEPDLAPHDAVVLPLIEPGQSTPTMILVAGVSPRRSLDADYRAFYTSLANHLSTALAAAHAYEAERKRAEALAEIDRAKTAFFSNVSHEFRTPLTLLLGPLEDSLAEPEGVLPPHQRERLEVMQRNGLRLLKLVNTLLDFARIEAGRIQAAYEPTDLARYTAELASSFRSLIEKAGMELIVDCPPVDGLAEPVYVDREMWEKVVLNLLSNAFKFTLEGSIAVSMRPVADESLVELRVRDTGVGIPADEVPHLFERFHRVEGMRARTHEGSGIGLALVQELVHLHSGTIEVESVEGVGTTFIVRLPIGVAHLPADRIQTTRPSMVPVAPALGAAAYVDEAARWLPDGPVPDSLTEGDSDGDSQGAVTLESNAPQRHLIPPTLTTAREIQRPARIVLADDNADMREYLARLLGEQYAVETVSNGAQALAAIQRDLPDLVLSDVMMPELDGFGLLRALRAQPKTATLPVILLSARAGEEATAEGLEAGADDYLVKPFSARDVLNRVAARLEIARIRTDASRRTREALEALLTMAEDLVRVPSATSERPETLSEIGSRFVVLFQRIFDCDMVSLCALDAATGTLQPMGLIGLDPGVKTRWWGDVSRIPIQEYLAPDVLARIYTGQAVELDIDAEPLRNGANYDIHRILLAPMLLGETVVGLMSIEYRRMARPYSANDLALMTAIGRLCALVLERERLLREREGALAQMLALAETTRRMNEFLGIASHELRTPLTTITANVQMAKMQLGSLNRIGDRELPDGLRPRLERAELLLERTNRQMVRLDRLVGDLLDVSRIEAGKLDMRLEMCDLLDIVRDMVREQRTAWSRRSIALELPRQTRLTVFADADRIGQVVTNYLTNALKYSLDDRPVVVRVQIQIQDDMARVEVRDQGPGLTAEQQAHVFERFYRAPGVEQLSGSGVGLGLGLHICKTIVERHDGAVGLESVVGVGSTFWFTLPLANATEAHE